MASNNNNNTKVVPEAKAALNQMKLEIASELGMSNYQQVDKGNLTARENGYVGGYMTKKLVEMAEQQMAGKGQQY
ncbi:small, acid-soluble spore protein, alpha/beta type [Terrisporobacter sp.]